MKGNDHAITLRAAVWGLSLVASGACSPKPSNLRNQTSAGQASSLASPPPAPVSFNAGSVFLSPANAKVALTHDAALATSGAVKGMSVPTLGLGFKNADFAQVLRCAVSYQVKTLSGQVVQGAIPAISREDQQWAWTQAVDQRQSCRMVGTFVVSPELEDLAAAQGTFYYVLNPCIAKEHSVSAKDECSFNLVFSSPLAYSGGFSETLRAKAEELSQAEADLNAVSERAVLLAKKIEMHLKACEDQVAHDSTMRAFRTGTVMLGGMVVGGALGAVVMGGPCGAIMGSQMVGMIGGQMAATKVFKLPQSIPNDCIDPQVLPRGKSGEGSLGKSKSAYEQEFGVQGLIQQLNGLLGESGEIASKQKALKDLLAAMNQLNQNVLTYDQALKKALQMGIDPNNPATYPK